MAKKSSIEKNNRRRKMTQQFANRRSKLKEIARDKTLPMEERFAATLKLAELQKQIINATWKLQRQATSGGGASPARPSSGAGVSPAIHPPLPPPPLKPQTP